MDEEQKGKNNGENNVPNNSKLQSLKGQNKHVNIYLAICIMVGFIATAAYYYSSLFTQQTILQEHNYESEIDGEEYFFTLQNCSTVIHLFVYKTFGSYLWEASLHENDIKVSKWATQENLAKAFNFIDNCIKNNMFNLEFNCLEELTIYFLKKAEQKNISLPLLALGKKMGNDILVSKIFHYLKKQKKTNKILSEKLKEAQVAIKNYSDIYKELFGDVKDAIIEFVKRCNNTLHQDSRILTMKDYITLKKWINPDYTKVNLKFLYYDNPCSLSHQLHYACDGKGATITIIKSEDDHLFGGYTTVSLDSLNDYQYDSNAFTFSLTHGVKCKIKNNSIAINRTASNIINFGSEEIVIKEVSYKNATSYSIGNSSYEIPKQYDPFTFYAGSKYFLVEYIEVYQVTIQ